MTAVAFFCVFFTRSKDNCPGNSITELVKDPFIVSIQFAYIGCFFRRYIEIVQNLCDV